MSSLIFVSVQMVKYHPDVLMTRVGWGRRREDAPPRVSMVARVGGARVTVDQATLVHTVRSLCVRRNVGTVADVLVPTDVPVSMDTLVDIVKLTTELDPVSEGLKMNNALDNWKV